MYMQVLLLQILLSVHDINTIAILHTEEVVANVVTAIITIHSINTCRYDINSLNFY